MSEIRPTLPDVASRPAAPGPSAAAKAAQAAFFQAALGAGAAGRSGMATQLTAQAAVTPSAPVRSEPASTAAPTDRLPRPGSLLDIRV